MNITIWSSLFLAFFICQALASPVVLSAKRKAKADPAAKIEGKPVNKKSAITEEERQFLREVEEKFNVKGAAKKKEYKKLDLKKLSHLPAVIAIEIVNDTAADGKGKRTIDANLGYGYQTNEGYTYNQFGESSGTRGKFVVYPYSQHDIPPASNADRIRYLSKTIYTNKHGQRTYVEVQPSKAYQLIPVEEEEEETENYNNVHDAISQTRSKYENLQGVETPPPPQYQGYTHQRPEVSTTLYTTYNGGHLSGLSGQFPSVMQNYYVNPSQIVAHPQYEQEQYIPQKRVIPVLILRIPSSQLQKPTAEIYPHLSLDNPYANLQALVHQFLQMYKAQETQAQQQQQQQQQQQNYDYEESYYQQQNQPQYVHQQQVEEEYSSTQAPQYAVQPQYGIPQSHYQSAAPYNTFSHAYNQLAANNHQEAGEKEEEEEQLPISENYPDAEHTNVIIPNGYNTHYSSTPEYETQYSSTPGYETHYSSTPAPQPSHSSPSHAVTFVTPTPYQKDGVTVSHRSHPAEETNYEETEEVSSQSPKLYNYHALPYPGKRQVQPQRPRRVRL